MADDDQRWRDHALAAVDPQQGLWRLVVSPVIAALHFTVVYIGSSVYCLRRPHVSLWDVQLAAAALTVLAVAAIGFCAWAAWRRLRLTRRTPALDVKRQQEVRFLARITLYLANLSWVGVLFVAAPLAFLSTCE